MRILSVHATYIRYKATKKTPVAEHLEVREDGMENCVVLFCSVEKLDEVSPDLVINRAREGVLSRLRQIGVARVVIFPYAHLTSTLGKPDIALHILNELEKTLLSEDIEVKRAPFGWYKEFEIKSKGHPLADLSMTICPYEGRECDFECPYCHNPIRVRDIPATSEAPGSDHLHGHDIPVVKEMIPMIREMPLSLDEVTVTGKIARTAEKKMIT
ncbi:MAG: threonyl-tRNA synthetase editing domain-containing protein [Methanomicrobiales archaeon]|nr:threonyl-tRNA synthetase editing domain-containing protein [Methanomicrobiales archaeon]